MANVAFLRGTAAQVATAPVVDGQLVVATDAGQLYVDVNTSRVPVNDILRVDTLGEATTAIVNKMYYATSTNILAVSNGTSWTQINAQLQITEGTEDGTISVGGVNVPVHGLGSAAYEESTAFDPAGSANAVLGTPDDTAGTNTVYGAKAEAAAAQEAAETAQEAVTNLQETVTQIQTTVGTAVQSVTAGDNSINVNSTTATAPAINVRISEDEDNVLELAADGLKVGKGAAPEYSIIKETTATEGYFATYRLTKDGANVGVAIDIPKDYLVKSASIESVETADTPYAGAVVGDKYIDFTVNSVDGDGNESHIYLPVKDLVAAYTAGNGIDISGSNAISVKVVAENGLSVSEAGVALAVASTSAAGAMSALDKSKLDGISAGAEPNYVRSVATPLTVSGAGELSIPVATTDAPGLMSPTDKTNVDAVVAGTAGYITSATAPLSVSGGALSIAEATTGAAGAMSATDKAKLDGITAGAQPNYVTSVTAPLTVADGALSIGAASATDAGTMSAADKSKLDGIAAGAEVNVVNGITFNGTTVSPNGSGICNIVFEWTDLS